MRTLCLLLLLVLELPIYAACARDEFHPDSIVRICRNVAAFRITRQHDNNWEPSPYFAGLMALYRLTGDHTYLRAQTGSGLRKSFKKLHLQRNTPKSATKNQGLTKIETGMK